MGQIKTIQLNKQQIAEVCDIIWKSRQTRLTDPEGYLDENGYWQPSEAEDAGGEGRATTAPHDRVRYGYQQHCRTLRHVRVLVGRALQGYTSPPDVERFLSAVAGKARTTSKQPAVQPVQSGSKVAGVIPDLPITSGMALEFALWLEERERALGRDSYQPARANAVKSVANGATA